MGRRLLPHENPDRSNETCRRILATTRKARSGCSRSKLTITDFSAGQDAPKGHVDFDPAALNDPALDRHTFRAG